MQSAIQEAVQHSLVIKTLDSLDYVVARLANTQQHLHSKVIEKQNIRVFGHLRQFGFCRRLFGDVRMGRF